MSEIVIGRATFVVQPQSPVLATARLAKAYGWLCFEIWLLIALGGGVRAMNAGLACPDWPLCFGDVIPDYHPQVYLEFIHRAMAGMVGIASLIMGILVLRTPHVRRSLKWLVFGSWVLLAAQIILGGLTVLLLLHEKVVVGHLLLAGAFFASNLWLYLSLKHPTAAPLKLSAFAKTSWAVLAVIVGQITLGGFVASHYAALVCTDFPLCHGQFIPTLKGVLGLHVMHRLGAYITALSVIGLGVWAWRSAAVPAPVRRATMWMVIIVLWQMLVGIANVLFYTPPLITVIHLASGMALLGLSLNQAKIAASLGGRDAATLAARHSR
ncbi:MAG: heme A synthase [Bdellovibrionales bacterium]